MTKLIDYEEWHPEHGFLADYLEYTSSHEGPARFQAWTALTVMASVVGRNVWIDKGFYYTFPTLWTILVAPTGKCRKTKTTRNGMDLVKELDVKVIADKITPEMFLHELGVTEENDTSEARGLIFASELSQFLSKASYNDSMVPILTDLADSPARWVYKKLSMEKPIVLNNVALCMLACSTPDVGGTSPLAAIRGGFLARFIFVVQHNTQRCEPFPKRQPEAKRRSLIEFLQKLQRAHGPFVLSVAAADFYTKWYKEERDYPLTDLRTAGYYERKPDHLLRVAMLLALSEDPKGRKLDLFHVQHALAMLNAIEEDMVHAVSAIAVTTTGRNTQRILEQIRQNKDGIEHTDLIRLNTSFLSADAVRLAIRTLIEGGYVEEEVGLN